MTETIRPAVAPTCRRLTVRALRGALALLVVLPLLVGVPAPADAAPPYPAPVMRGYVPLAADATRQTLANASPKAGTTLDFTVGITNAGAGAVMYYDHWEDGYEADITRPVQPTTQVWGDGDPSNGDASLVCRSVCAGDRLPAGAVFVMRNNVPTPRTTAVLWDGRDRVSSTRGFTITAGGFTTAIGSLLSASASAYDTSKWGVDHWVPIGQDMVPPPGTSHAFSTTNIQVMADQPGTLVEVDRNGDGRVDLSQTIGAGEVMFVSGGVNRGARVRSSAPVQVHVGAGDTTAEYEMRWFSLFPTSLLTADYLNPVGSNESNQRTVTYLFNPNDTAITVTPACTGCSGTIPVPARQGARFSSPLGQAVRFTSGGAPFVAVGAVGSESGAQPGGGSDSSSGYDWGFSLVPTDLLTTKAVLGWAPGNSNNPPSSPSGNRDDSPVWISPLATTDIYIDRDGNPETGALTGSCDGRYDEVRRVTALQSVRIHDHIDGDMTGASIYTCDGTRIAGAWGQDPENAPASAPGFDAGYALIPSTAMLVDKTAGLGEDTNGDGRFGPGDVIDYEITIADAGALSFTDLRVSDAIPAGTSYVPGSTTYDDGRGGGPAPFPDDATPPAATPYPFDEAGAALPTIDPGETVTIQYQVAIDNPFPAGTAISNVVVVGADQTGGGDTIVTELVAADLSLDKAVTAAPTYLGEEATFTLTLVNSGPDAAEGVVVNDALQPALGFVSATPSHGSYDPATGDWTVGTLAAGQTATLQLVATVDALTVTNEAQVTASLAADPDSTPDNGVRGEDDDATVTVTVQPRADVSLTKVRDEGPDEVGHTTFTLTVTNAGPSPATGLEVTDQLPEGATFVAATPQTNPAVDGTFDGATGVWTVPELAPGAQARMQVVHHTPVAPAVNYAQVTASDVVDPDSQPSSTPLSPANPPDEDDEAEAGIPALADVSLANVVTAAPTHVGDLATFRVTVTNDGPTNTTDVLVVDRLPDGLSFAAATPSAGAYDPITGVWAIGPMSPGGVETLELTARVLAAGTLATTAEVTASSALDPDSTPGNADPDEDDQATATVATTGGTLGDRVWYDVDLDGAVGADEPGLAGVAVTARWAGPNGTTSDGDDLTYTATTDASGAWSLIDLPHGAYVVSVDPATLPSGITTATRDRDGTASPSTTALVLDGGQSLVDVDFAYTGSAVLGDTVFRDVDGDGSAGPGEGLAGVRVTATWAGADGTFGTGDDLTYGTTTDAAGAWTLANLPAGEHRVVVDPSSLPAGLRSTVDPDGGEDGTADLILATGEERRDADFGYVGTNAIGDTVFADLDGDGVQGPAEPGLGGVTVTLLQAGGPEGTDEVIGTATTSGGGTYGFGDLPAGRYRVELTPPPGLAPSTPTAVDVVLTDGDTVVDADFGLLPPGAATPAGIGDLVWDDADGDGQPDPDEDGLAGVRVVLRADLDGDGTYETAYGSQLTGDDGGYGFANLPPGRYQVTVEPPTGAVPSTPASRAVTLRAGSSRDDVDFGLSAGPVAPGSIGDLVWDDTDGNGQHDAGEPGLAGVEVTLRHDADGDGVHEAVATATSDADGRYSFDDLPPGAYLVVVSPPAGTNATTPTAVPVLLGAGQDAGDADFGLTSAVVASGSIGDRIWLDSDVDGVEDPGEPGVNGVTVRLHVDTDGDGSFETLLATATTSGDGTYQFPSLAPGRYHVTVEPPPGLSATVPGVVVALLAGEVVTTADLGLAPAASTPYDLHVDKRAEGPAVEGDLMTWVITVTNAGPGPSPAVLTVTDTLIDDLDLRSAGGEGWTCATSGQTATCTGGGPLEPGEEAEVTVTAVVRGTAGAIITNTATVGAGDGELSVGGNASTAEVTVQAAPTPPTPPTPPPSDPGPASGPRDPNPGPGSYADPDPARHAPSWRGPLPRTGAEAGALLLVAAGLVLGGAGLAALARRRTASDPAPER